MTFAFWDYVVMGIYFGVSLVLGIIATQRGGKSLSEYFLSGRATPWWLAGTSMVATTFAADTPLAVAGFVATGGIAGNWIWWCSAAGGMLTVFFFARLWRRSGAMTDLELVEIRYSGRPAAFLRGFKAVYFGLFLNCIVLGWVNLAMLKVLRVTLPGAPAELMLVISACVTGLYVFASGLWGVAMTDAFQFIVAMTGCIALAILAMGHPAIAGAGGIKAVLPPQMFEFLPRIGGSDDAGIFHTSAVAFAAYVGVQWWASWYPGAEPGGGGYIAQRIMSAKDEKAGFLATLWFVIAHYCVRPWPWIFAGLAAVVLYPTLAANQKEDGYVFLMRDLLGTPFAGLLIAAFFGAYMSTLSSQLNWGSGYIVNDLYRRFMKKDGDDAHYVRAARMTTLLMLAGSLFVTFFVLETIAGAWKFLLECGAGTGFVLIFRWYWWRLNAYSEISSMVAAVLGVVILRVVAALGGPSLPFPESLFVLVPITLLVTLLVTFITKPDSEEKLRDFYARVQPPGPGWARFGRGRPMGRLFIGWGAGTVLLYTLLFSAGSFLLGEVTRAIWLGTLALIVSVVLAWVIRAEFRNDELS